MKHKNIIIANSFIGAANGAPFGVKVELDTLTVLDDDTVAYDITLEHADGMVDMYIAVSNITPSTPIASVPYEFLCCDAPTLNRYIEHTLDDPLTVALALQKDVIILPVPPRTPRDPFEWLPYTNKTTRTETQQMVRHLERANCHKTDIYTAALLRAVYGDTIPLLHAGFDKAQELYILSLN